MTTDRIYDWKAGRLFLYAQYAHDILGTAGADTGSNAGGPVVAEQAGNGSMSIVQVAAAADEIQFWGPIPYDMARDQKVLGRIWFVHRSTDADTPIFDVKTKFHAKQATVVDFDTSEDVTTTFAAHTCSTTAESLEVTAWTDLSWDSYLTATDVLFGLILIATNLGSASANEIELIGFEIAYEVEAMHSQGRRQTSNQVLHEQPL